VTSDGDARPRAVPAVRALALTALTAPVVAIAHLITTGTTPPALAVLAVAAAAFALGAAVPAAGPRALAVLLGAAQLTGHAVLALLATGGPATAGAPAGCLPTVGRGADLGLRIALYGETGCPPGTYAGGTLSHAALAAVAAAAAIVTCHLLVASAGGRLLAVAERCARTVREIVAVIRPVPARLPRPPFLPQRTALPPARDDRPAPRFHLPVPITHRGPPPLPA
jgi:hypothetical protein